jgi:multidrug efflux pump
MLMVLVATIALNVSLYKAIPKGFFPQQDTGRIFGNIRADQSSSFQSMQERLDQFMAVVKAEPAVDNVTGFTGGGQRNSAQMFITLKPRSERDISADQLVSKLRSEISQRGWCEAFPNPLMRHSNWRSNFQLSVRVHHQGGRIARTQGVGIEGS